MTETTTSTGRERASHLRRRHVTRELLLDAASVVLAREGFQGASVEHICEQAGYTRGAFYSNFSSKDELLMALFERERDAMIDRMQQAAGPAGLDGLTFDEALPTIMDRFIVLQPVERDWYLMHAEFSLRAVRGDEVGQAFAAARRVIKSLISQLIEQVLAQFGRRIAIPPEHVAALLMGAYDHAVEDALIDGRDLDASLLSDTLPRVLADVTAPV